MGFLENLEASLNYDDFETPRWDFVDPDTGDAFRVIQKVQPFLKESR